MTPFFAKKGFHPNLSLDLFQPSSNQEAQDLAQHINNIIKQLKTNLLTLQEAQRFAANLHKVPAPSYQVGNQA